MLTRWRRWREDRLLARVTLDETRWRELSSLYPPGRSWPAPLQQHWRELALRFLVRKRFLSGAGFAISEDMRLQVAALAVLPVLGLGLDWYDDWDHLVLYETAFIPPFPEQDEFGLVHPPGEARAGEAWDDGPVILSWEDILAPAGPDCNVVIHEMAHKLDMRNGLADGAPPLHRGMSAARWQAVMQQAWEQAHQHEAAGLPLPLDEYGLTEPAEFFSVLSEHFFMAPDALAAAWPEVYEQLALFYRVDPLRPDLFPWS